METVAGPKMREGLGANKDRKYKTKRGNIASRKAFKIFSTCKCVLPLLPSVLPLDSAYSSKKKKREYPQMAPKMAHETYQKWHMTYFLTAFRTQE